MKDFIFKTKYWGVDLAEDQTYFGRLVIVLNRECESFADLNSEEQSDLFDIFKKLETFYKEKYNATMFNYTCLMNYAHRDNEKAQVHIHFRPRYKDKITVNNEVFKDPNFGNHYIPTAFGIKRELSEEQKLDLSNNLSEYFK